MKILSTVKKHRVVSGYFLLVTLSFVYDPHPGLIFAVLALAVALFLNGDPFAVEEKENENIART